MKSKNKSEKSIFGHIQQNLKRLGPIKTEKFKSSNDERMTRIYYDPPIRTRILDQQTNGWQTLVKNRV